MISVILYIIALISIFYLLNRKNYFLKTDLSNKTLSILLLIKVFAGFTLYYIYSNFYPDRKLADIFKYYDDSQVLIRVLYEDPMSFFKILLGFQNDNTHSGYFNEMYTWYTSGFGSDSLINDSRALIRLSAIFHFLSFGNYHLHTFLFSLLGFFGQLFMYKGMRIISAKENKLIIITACFLLPSVVLWSSGILKESIVILGIGLIVFSIANLLIKKKNSFLTMIGGVFCLTFYKYYILICLIPAFIPIFLNKYWSFKKVFVVSLVTIVTLGLLAINLPSIGIPIDIMNMFAKKHDDFYLLALQMDAGSISYIGKYKPFLVEFLPKLPLAFLNVFLQPFPHLLFQYPSLTLIPAIIENTFLVLFPLVFLKTIVKPKKEALCFILFSLIFIIILYLITGLTTPVIGGLVRYKVPALSVYIFSLSLLVDPNKFTNRYFIRIRNIFKNVFFIE